MTINHYAHSSAGRQAPAVQRPPPLSLSLSTAHPCSHALDAAPTSKCSHDYELNYKKNTTITIYNNYNIYRYYIQICTSPRFSIYKSESSAWLGACASIRRLPPTSRCFRRDFKHSFVASLLFLRGGRPPCRLIIFYYYYQLL